MVMVILVLIVWFVPFKWIERLFGLAGDAIVIFAVAAVAHGVVWGAAARGLVPRLPQGGSDIPPSETFPIVQPQWVTLWVEIQEGNRMTAGRSGGGSP
jgi:hypothetical protein